MGYDSTIISKFADGLARALGYKYIDEKSYFELQLLDNIDIPLILDEEYAESRERLLLSNIANKENIVATIPIDVFIANNNYKLLKNSFIILIAKEKLDNELKDCNFDENIENFIKKRVDLVLKQENLKINEILNKFKG